MNTNYGYTTFTRLHTELRRRYWTEREVVLFLAPYLEKVESLDKQEKFAEANEWLWCVIQRVKDCGIPHCWDGEQMVFPFLPFVP